ncbi:MAG TPA: alpha-2-macroglobulin family protein, partial [Thermoanaerobaculia bacterium]|nr:alpha-2-macroglobulin family protein [Thermoanaerobaculia bacterium]
MPTVLSVSQRLRIAVLVSALAGIAAFPVTPKPSPAAPPTWAEVDRLVKDQKLREASGLVDRLLESAKRRHDEAGWTKALVRGTQLRIGLGSYETAVRFLKEQPWPPGLLSQTTLDLFYAQALVQYERAYAWEIAQRESVAIEGELDLKLETRDQLYEEAQEAYARVWARRAELGALPVGALAEYVEPNDYPKDVRGTLRDAVSYLYAELLADSALWKPNQGSEVYRLDLAALLSEDGAAASPAFAERGAHPISKLVAVLADLESWHEGRGERSAELEARLERDRRLHAAYMTPEDRERIRKDLEARLATYRQIPWWSMGMARLAELWQAEDEPDNLVRAHGSALEGARAFPESPGGVLCARVLDAIDAPDYQLTAMSSDAPDRRSIEVVHKNLPRLFFRIYAADLDRRIGEPRFDLNPSAEEVRALVRSGRPASAWTEDLPATPDYKNHRTFVTPKAGRGLWIVVASARADFAERENRVVSAAVLLGHLVMLTDADASRVETRVVDGSGAAASGTEVTLYAFDWQSGHSARVAAIVTGTDGLARFEGDRSDERRSFFLVARRRGDAAVDRSAFSLAARTPPAETTAALVYTDRAIYRPLQTVKWKAVAYGGRADLGRFRVSPRTPVTVRLRDRNSEVVETATAVTDDYGAAAGEFRIPAGRALGSWSVECDPRGSAGIRVEEYKRPTFEVKWEAPDEPPRLNRPAVLRGSARYYFGLPVSAGKVRWQVWRRPEFPWWWQWRHPWVGRDGGGIVAQGEAPLKADGTFEASFTPMADERAADAKELSFYFQATADVTDDGGETRSDTRPFTLGFVAVSASLSLESGFFRAGQPGVVTVLRTDLDGAPRPGVGTWRLVSLAVPDRALRPSEVPALPHFDDTVTTPGDRLRPRWAAAESLKVTLRGWKDGPERARGGVTHDAQGRGRIDLPALPAGAWRLRYETRDDSGGVCAREEDFLVAGATTPVPVAAVLLVERASVEVGGVARVLAFAGLPGQPWVLERLRSGEVVSRETLSGDARSVFEFPIREEDRGGFALRLSLVSDHQVITETAPILVPWTDRELSVSFASFRDRIRPGARETWRVTVRAPAGAAGEERTAQLLAYMYDRSLDAFGSYDPPNPLSLYPNHANAGYLRSSVSAAGAAWVFDNAFGARGATVLLHADRPKFLEGYGIGGPGVRMFAQRAMAKSETGATNAAVDAMKEGVAGGIAGAPAPASAPAPGRGPVATGEAPPSPVLRSDFSETGFWKPQLLTDADGSAVIEFQVPDSVTSWNVWVHAITKGLAAGSVHRETRSVKDLMVRPYVPRFLREGDRGELKVVVNNASDRPMSGTVALDILDTDTNRSVLAEFGLSPDTASRAFTATAGGSADATFTLAAPKRVGAYAIQATAVSGDLSDGELRPVPVLPGRMQLAQSRFAALRGGDTRTLSFADMAKTDDPGRVNEQLAVTVDAQLFDSVLNALPYLVNYPYECVEQTLNRFVSTGIVSSLFRQYPAVERMAQDLAKRDTPLEAWAAPDPTRRMALEETPWLEEAKGGKDAGPGLVKVLDPRAAAAEREASLAKLRR